jgi:hypothetical protein
MSRVIVIQNTRYPADVSPAKIYGTIEFVLGPGDRTSSNPEQSARKLFDALETFEPEHDFVLWAGGDPLSCMLTGAVLAELGILRYKYLRFEKERGKGGHGEPVTGFYVPVQVDMQASQPA